MNAYSTRGLAGLALLCGALGAQPRLNEYALILQDAPVARQVASGKELRTRAALDHGSRIAAAQRRVTDELARRNIRVTGSAQTLVNAVFVSAASGRVKELGALPGVARVQYLPPVHRKLDRALDLVHASAAWSALGGQQNAGKGVRIAILDTGIDQDQPAFQDTSLQPPSGFPKGETDYTNSKVIVARSYVAMLPFALVDASDSRPDDVTPRDRSGHGTAIAMIAAGGRVSAPLAAISGIAPKAFLGNYKIFGSPGGNDTTRTPVIIQALEDAISDHMDIAVLPVGDPAVYGATQEDPSCAGNPQPFGIPSDACDVRAQAVENAVHLGLTVVTPAGNEGDSGLYYPALASVDTPGTAPSAITVGATANAHVLYAGVILPGRAAPINTLFGDGPRLTAAMNAPLQDVSQLQNDGRACTALAPNALAGSIALVQRGDCAFSIKVTNAANAGARAAVIVQSAGNEFPFSPTGLGTTAIPAAMVGNSDGATLQNFARANSGQKVTLDPSVHAVDEAPDVVASFSSRGPAIWKSAIKPELVAPGADLYTAAQSYDPNGDVYDASGFTGVSGTSFAAGLVAGAAALVKEAHPKFTPAQIKSALVNTASNQVLDNGANASITAAGAGKLDAGAAVNTTATVEPATVSFGEVGSNVALPVSVPLTLSNATSASMRVTIQVAPSVQDALAAVTVSPNAVSLAAGQTQQLNVQLKGSQPAPGLYEGFLQISAGSGTLHVPYLYVVGDGIADNVLPLAGASFTGSVNDQDFFLILKTIDRYGVAVPAEPVTFNTVTGDGVITAADPATDVLGIAAAKVNLGSQLGEQIFSADAAGFHVEFDGRARLRPTINAGGVVNAGDHQAGQGFAPGSYVEIYGVGLSEATRVAATPYLPVSLAGVSVSFDAPGLSVPGHLYFVTPNQVDVQIPWELQGLSSALMKVSVGASQSAVYIVPLANVSPAAFEIPDSSGNRLVIAARDGNNKVISTANPARRGQTISLYVNGLGEVDNTPVSGDPTAAQPLASTLATPHVTIGGVDAAVTFNGLSPFSVSLYQINVTVPAQAPTGRQPIKITINGIDSKASSLPVQ
jgi:minor extracellular serine protease Vpr